jgi:hypothetical protein
MTVIARVIANRIYHFVIAMWSAKEAKSTAVKYWEIIADNLTRAGWLAAVSQVRITKAAILGCGRRARGCRTLYCAQR